MGLKHQMGAHEGRVAQPLLGRQSSPGPWEPVVPVSWQLKLLVTVLVGTITRCC